MVETPGSPSTVPARRKSVALVKGAVIVAVGALFVLGALGLLLWSQRPVLSESEIRDAVYSTIQSEAPASFLVTGVINVTTTTRVRNTRTLLPGIIGLNMGTNTAVVRVPGRISYGFDVRELKPEMITVHEDGVVEVAIPEPVLYASEPDLQRMELETDRGWARVSDGTMADVRDRAIELVQSTMRTQGERHLQSSTQPQINTAHALHRMLRPALIAAGLENPEFRFRIGSNVVIEP